MKTNRWGIAMAFLAVFAAVNAWLPESVRAFQSYLNEPLIYEEVLTGLRDYQGDELQQLLFKLQLRLDASRFSDEELAQLIEELNRIANRDVSGSGESRTTAYTIKVVAKSLVPRLEDKNVKSRLQALPEDQRLVLILNEMETDGDLTKEHRRELVRMGPKAVPLILVRAPKLTKHKGMAITVLGEIADPRAREFLAGVLNDREHSTTMDRVLAARALAAFEGEKVLRSLIQALSDDSFDSVDRCLAEKNKPEYRPCMARYYKIQHVVSDALARVAGRHWGWLYQEDFKTWSAWLKSKDRSSFRPFDVKRTPQERDALVEKLFHRYMSGRPNPHRVPNSLNDLIAVKTMARDLRAYGKDIIKPIMKQYAAQGSTAPGWNERLAPWVVRVLRALEIPEATAAADSLEASMPGARKDSRTSDRKGDDQ